LKTAVFSTREYDRRFLDEANRKFKHELIYHAESLQQAANGPRRAQRRFARSQRFTGGYRASFTKMLIRRASRLMEAFKSTPIPISRMRC
jgi:hypothetical protein